MPSGLENTHDCDHDAAAYSISAYEVLSAESAHSVDSQTKSRNIQNIIASFAGSMESATAKAALQRFDGALHPRRQGPEGCQAMLGSSKNQTRGGRLALCDALMAVI